MPIHDDLGTRMKEYEKVSRNFLVRRVPVAIRIDGQHFHSFCKGFKRPFDTIFTNAMNTTMIELCKNIQGCVFGYVQSDEITLILQDYATIKTDAWFEYNVQKLTSISASMTTLYFNRAIDNELSSYINYLLEAYPHNEKWPPEDEDKYVDKINNQWLKGATFDSRAFNIPKDEVVNLVYWRQLDAIRNSIQACGQSMYSHKQLEGKSCAMIKEMLAADGKPWEDLPIAFQRGRACYRDEEYGWILDEEMPVLKGEDREYLERLI